LTDIGGSRLEKSRTQRRQVKRLALLVAAVLVLGLVVGAGANLLLGKQKKATQAKSTSAKPAVTKASSASSEAESSAKAARGPTTPQFSISQSMAHTYALSVQIGNRPAGSGKEASAGDYIVARLNEYGYAVEEQAFTTSDGFSSRNIVGTRAGTREGYTIIVGAHYDSQRSGAGAIDDASGVGVVLELARVFSVRHLEPALQFVFFGANEPGQATEEDRFVGSKRFVDLLGTIEKKDIVAMFALDCVGQGDVLALRTQGTGLQRLKDQLETFARAKNTPVTYIKSTTDSDNIAFENSQIPAVWVEWCEQGGSPAPDNGYTGVVAQKEETAGLLVEKFLLELSPQDLEELKY